MKYGYGADNRRIYEVKRAAVFTNGDTIEEYVTWWSGQQRVGRYKVRWNSEMPNNGQPNSFVFARVELENVWFGSKPLRLGAETNVAVDRLGSVRRSGRDYFPYGQEAPTTTAGDKEKYATYRHDGATDLSYADQRYYATGAGRFMTADPYMHNPKTENPQSWNLYAYAGGDPTNNIDRMGLFMDPCANVGCLMAPPDMDGSGTGGGGILWAGGPLCAYNSWLPVPVCLVPAGVAVAAAEPAPEKKRIPNLKFIGAGRLSGDEPRSECDGAFGWFLDLTYQVVDQDGAPMAGLHMQETITNQTITLAGRPPQPYPDPNGGKPVELDLYSPGGVAKTDISGKFHDRPFGSCAPEGYTVSFTQTFLADGVSLGTYSMSFSLLPGNQIQVVSPLIPGGSLTSAPLSPRR